MDSTDFRFTDNDNGTVTDNKTGLVWLKDASCCGALPWLKPEDLAKLEKSRAKNPQVTSWPEQVVAKLADGQCGLTDGSKPGDWHVPSLNEMLTLLDYRFLPAVPDAAGSGPWTPGNPFLNLITNQPYWSNTPIFLPAPPPIPYSWFVYYGGGNMATDFWFAEHYVWPVRGTITQPEPRYTDNGDGTVTDNLSEVVWLKNANAFGQTTWDTAVDIAANLADGQAGLCDGSKPGDWRLPGIEEIESLFDPRYNNPAIADTQGTGQWSQGNAFDNIQFTNLYWSGTEYAGRSACGDYSSSVVGALERIADTLQANASSNSVWVSLISVGNVATTEKNGFFFVWPVRAKK